MTKHVRRILWIVAGWTAFLLGFIGAFLPLLPTTPFMILAAYCFSKGSERLHAWLLSLPKIGGYIRDWEKHGVIRLRPKILATVMIVALFSYTLIFVYVKLWIKITVALTGICSLTFIWTRPSKPKAA